MDQFHHRIATISHEVYEKNIIEKRKTPKWKGVDINGRNTIRKER